MRALVPRTDPSSAMGALEEHSCSLKASLLACGSLHLEQATGASELERLLGVMTLGLLCWWDVLWEDAEVGVSNTDLTGVMVDLMGV